MDFIHGPLVLIKKMRQLLFTCLLTILTANGMAQLKEQSNKHFSNTEKTTAPPETIWKIWTDVSNWKDWDTGLKDASVKAGFELNARGEIISLEGRRSKFTVVAFETNKSYTFKTKLPLGALFIKRTLEIKNGTTYFTHEVWFKGLSSGIFAKKLGPKFRKMLPLVMENIKTIAEK